MKTPKSKILYVTLINLFGVIIAWLVEVFSNSNGISIDNFIQEFFFSGMSITLPILMIIALLDYFYLSKKPREIFSILTLQWILLSLPFIYWGIKNTHNRSLNVLIVVTFLFVQCVKYWLIKRYFTKHAS